MLKPGRGYTTSRPTRNVQTIGGMWLKWGNIWRRVDYGIDFANYSGLDPDNGARADPALRGGTSAISRNSKCGRFPLRMAMLPRPTELGGLRRPEEGDGLHAG